MNSRLDIGHQIHPCGMLALIRGQRQMMFAQPLYLEVRCHAFVTGKFPRIDCAMSNRQSDAIEKLHPATS